MLSPPGIRGVGGEARGQVVVVGRSKIGNRSGSGKPVMVAIAEFYTCGLLGILTWWVDQGFPHGPVHVAQMYGAMANPGIVAVIGHPPPSDTSPATTNAPKR
jgi:hypothetical protein